MSRPNIVYIYADDLGHGLLSCYGQRHYRTPNIDRIAHEGARFNRAYGTAFCAPARACLLRGQHDAHAGRWAFNLGGLYNHHTAGRYDLNQLAEIAHAYETQLYNLADDPREQHNLSEQQPEVAARLAAALLRECDGNYVHGTPHAHFAFYPEPRENFLFPAD